jgi:hypothetical protein
MTKDNTEDLLKLEGEVVKAGLAMQQSSLELLQAEIKALAAILPGQPAPERSDAEVEADFDNMPV